MSDERYRREQTTVIMRTTASTVAPLILVVAVALFVQGHNLPGGGFIGGVLATTAFVLIYVAYGLDFLEQQVLGRDIDPGTGTFENRIVVAYRRLFAFGLVVAVVSGLVALPFGLPFLSQDFTHLHGVPVYGDVELASAVVFDLGVFCVVVGGLLTILSVVGAE